MLKAEKEIYNTRPPHKGRVPYGRKILIQDVKASRIRGNKRFCHD